MCNRANGAMVKVSKVTDFRNISFGYRSAEAERRAKPQLLDEGFLDEDGYIERLTEGSSFLVLGHKGSGKSAIAEHIDLSSQGRYDRFVDVLQLRDFPFDQIPLIIPGEGNETIRTNLAWSLLLLLRLFDSLIQDKGATVVSADLERIARELRGLGLLSRPRLRD